MTTNFCQFLLAPVVSIFLCTCSGDASEPQLREFTELAMKENMRISARNANGSIIIEYISPLERRYIWDYFDEKRTLTPREVRWLGRLGAFEPAESSAFRWFSPRIVAEDSQLNFANYDEVYRWLDAGESVLDWVYTDDGLVVGFAKSPDRNQVNIEVYQLLIDGEQPSGLSGNNEDDILVEMR